MLIEDGTKRVVIEQVRPEIDAGRFPIKRVLGENVVVELTAYSDAHDVVSGCLLDRPATSLAWNETPLESLGQDRWRGEFRPTELGLHVYTVEAWVDEFRSWVRDLGKRAQAGQVAQNGSDYNRAMVACVEGRGYSAR